MDTLTIPLAFGCVLSFSHIDKEWMKTYELEPEEVVYKIATLTDSRGHKHVLVPPSYDQVIASKGYGNTGPSPDGLFASFIVLSQTATRLTERVYFISARTCAPVRFVRVRDGRTVGIDDYLGWDEDSPHAMRVRDRKSAKSESPGMPIDEAKLLNPAIKDQE